MKREKVIDKIKKLLAMAEDKGSPEEAGIAARQARFLMDKHQVEDGEVTEGKKQAQYEFNTDYGHKMYHRNQRWYEILSIAVAKLNDCQCVGFKGTGITYFKGLKSDVQITVLMLKWLSDMIERETQYLGPIGRLGKNEFKRGFAAGIGEQCKNILVARTKKVEGTSTALVVMKKQLVEKEFGVCSYGTKKDSTGTPYYAMGKEQGLNTQLHEKVSQ